VTAHPAASAGAAGQRPGRSRALVVDDEAGLVEIVSAYLSREGFTVEAAADGEQAVELARRDAPDVIVLDLGLPGIDGIEACRQIRSFSDAYIMILTARAEEHEKIAGLSTGADDYLTKPFSPGELVARIRAMLRRPRIAAASTSARRQFGPLELDSAAREVLVEGALVELTKLEFDLLDALTASPRLVFSRGQLLEQVWGSGWFGDDHLVDVHIANLRRKLGHPELIRTVRGVGYRLGVV
jgi:DNA-binding response OmpR family regulator